MHLWPMTSKVTFKGQVVIPALLRRKMGIRRGTRVVFQERNGELVLQPATPEFYRKMCGILKGGGLLKDLEQTRRQDKRKEDSRFADS